MRIVVGADHRGFQMKNAIADSLRAAGHDVTDVGTDSAESVDYPDIAVVIAIFATAVISMFVAVRVIGPVRLATFLCLEPVTAIFVAVVALGEHLKGGQWLGVALIGFALLMASRRPGR